MINRILMELRQAIDAEKQEWDERGFRPQVAKALDDLYTKFAFSLQYLPKPKPVAELEVWPDDRRPLAIMPLVDLKHLPEGTKFYVEGVFRDESALMWQRRYEWVIENAGLINEIARQYNHNCGTDFMSYVKQRVAEQIKNRGVDNA